MSEELKALCEEAKAMALEYIDQHAPELRIGLSVSTWSLGYAYACVSFRDTPGCIAIWIDSKDWPSLTTAQRRFAIWHELRHLKPDGVGNVFLQRHDIRLGIFDDDVPLLPDSTDGLKDGAARFLKLVAEASGSDSIVTALQWLDRGREPDA